MLFLFILCFFFFGKWYFECFITHVKDLQEDIKCRMKLECNESFQVAIV